MKRASMTSILLAAALGCAAATALGQPAAQREKPAADTEEPPPPQYRPPLRGSVAATRRVSGGTRGWGDVDVPLLVAVAPEHAGLTARASPALFWYLSRPTTLPLVVTLIEEDAVRPQLELELDGAKRAGLHRVDLARLGVALKPGTDYEWSVALVLDREERSRDIIAQGAIRSAPSAELAARAERAPAEAAFVYAEQGFFYDAFHALSDAIEADPAGARARAHRRALLEQIGLPEVGASER